MQIVLEYFKYFNEKIKVKYLVKIDKLTARMKRINDPVLHMNIGLIHG